MLGHELQCIHKFLDVSMENLSFGISPNFLFFCVSLFKPFHAFIALILGFLSAEVQGQIVMLLSVC